MKMDFNILKMMVKINRLSDSALPIRFLEMLLVSINNAFLTTKGTKKKKDTKFYLLCL